MDQTVAGDPPCTAEAFPAEPVLDALTPLRQGFVPSGGALASVDLCLTVDTGDVTDGVPPLTVNIIDLDAEGGETVVADDKLPAAVLEALAAKFRTVPAPRTVYPYNFACPSGVSRQEDTNFGLTEPYSPWGDAVAGE